MKKFLTAFGLLFFSAFAFAQENLPVPEVPQEIGDLSKFLPALIEAFQSGKWLIVAAIVVLFLTLAFRQFILPKLKVSTGVLPWVNLAFAAINGIAAVVIGGMPLQQAAVMVLISGGLAAQIWDLGGKKIMEILLKFLGNKELGK